jgi:hypothetical protein
MLATKLIFDILRSKIMLAKDLKRYYSVIAQALEGNRRDCNTMEKQCSRRQ